MANKKFLYGLTLGVVGTTLFRSSKHIIKPIAVKSFKGFSSIKKEAQENRKKYYNNQKNYFEKPSSESIFYSTDRNDGQLDSKSSINELENQINVLKDQMSEFNKKMSQL